MPGSAEAIERDLAEAAILKRRAGKRATSQELAALRRIERRKEEEDRRRYYATVPQRHYRELSGRQAKILAEQAQRHDLPIAGKTVDLGLVLRRFHDLLAENKFRLARPEVPGGETRDAAELRDKVAAANIREIRAREAAGELVPAEAVRRLFVQHVAAARAIFDQVPDRVLAALPQRLKAGVRRRVQTETRRIVDDVCETLADLLADCRLPEEGDEVTR